MKKVVTIIMALLMNIIASAQVTIQMEKEGGVYKVPCTVNGVKMKFVFDTGAASVCISHSMAQFLLDGGYLSADDIVGTGQSQVADGSLVNHVEIILRDVEIGGMHIHNIKAVVIEGQNASLLLGQSAISELGRVTIDGNRIVIHSANNELTEEQIDELDKQIDRLIDAQSYAAAIDCLLKMESTEGLSEYGLLLLCRCYFFCHQWDDCIRAGKRWILEYESSGSIDAKGDVYLYLGNSYYQKGDYHSALSWHQKELDIWENYDLKSFYKSSFFDDRRDILTIANIYFNIANCYSELESFHQAIPNFKKAINLYCEHLNINIKDIQNNKVHDEMLGNYLYCYALCYYQQKKDADGDEVMKLAALCGSQYAIDFCGKYNINYQMKSSSLFD